MEITMYHYLFIGMLMFLIGLLGSVLVKNMIKVLISIEIMLLGVNINFVTFASFCDNVKFDGYIMALFYVGLGAVELAVALYLFYLMFQKKGSDNIESYKEL
ncbi:MAG: NADH-quinone oxidoreductase subunit NuoK [Acinetobacter sp.]|jgi:NAD(P)H-quinone oxidoreductase subunit 4L, chloroplastic|nr:NADH-quinone oxidoreductase subunit NuoK [Acinetobacter sp.]DAB01480.1 MAG TPA: NADH-quinone oxidoreductase subunit NuoK [Candidatus Gastranaerophilales bacterium HUM_10]DAB10681.1 MAG TPA: NADH-quinone oxidoreductase subunit NuoK [Candidatus Gastranaerophilales bacterium HUM_16]DAB13013.1 MAG TPA: NADH-quinone oxidoreductase subunit NuoK [Candidatus Gastranaerophilales bacterium HUM_17]DAB17891.1 MAG TPA: NADH-quinone oxidoreductase subunit NuoK [Candidatus Gastranaerophilales bacterium HUM